MKHLSRSSAEKVQGLGPEQVERQSELLSELAMLGQELELVG